MASRPEATDNGPQITNITSESINTSHNVAVITHSRFLVAVPSQVLRNPLSRANYIAGRLLENTSPSELKKVAESAICTTDTIFIVLSVLLTMGFIGCSVTRAIHHHYYALFWFQPFFAVLVYFLIWAAQNLWKPQHVVLCAETGMLHSRKNSFVRPIAIPLSSIRFFRKTASYKPNSCNNSGVRYGVEAVTTGQGFSFAFGRSEHVADQLGEALNNFLKSVEGTSPPLILGNVGSSAACLTLSEQEVHEVEALPSDSNISFDQRDHEITFMFHHRWVAEALYITIALFAVWIICLSLAFVTAGGAAGKLFGSPSVIFGTALYLSACAGFVYMWVWKESWTFSESQDAKTHLKRGLSGRRVVKVTDYNHLKLLRKEALTLSSFEQNTKRGTECLCGKRYGLNLENEQDEICVLGTLTEGEAMFVWAKLGKTFPFLFGKKSCDV